MKTELKSIHDTINDFVKEDISRTGVFENLGIDSCCGGHKTLEESCREKGLDPEVVLKQLMDQGAESSPEQERNWVEAPLDELVDHIEHTHHAYLKKALPVINGLLEKVLGVHGERHPELNDLMQAFAELKADLEPHLMKEENILFPMIRKIDSGEGAAPSHCGSIQNPIRVMMAEHDRAGALLKEIRTITGDYTVPEDGCESYKVLFKEMQKLEEDLLLHIHKENDILFPGAREEESLIS